MTFFVTLSLTKGDKMPIMSCPFCDLISERYRLLEEADDHVVILSNPRMTPGHTLVIPKRHILKPSEMTADERKHVFDAAIRWQDKITAVFSAGCDIRQNYRPFIKQNELKIDHVHFHLIPREPEDGLYRAVEYKNASVFAPLTDEEVTKFHGLYLK